MSRPSYCQLDEKHLPKLLATRPDIRLGKSRCLAESQVSLTQSGGVSGRPGGLVGVGHWAFWKNGRAYVVSRTGDCQEVLYLHFMGLKRSYHWWHYRPDVRYSEYSFSAAGFRPWIKAPSLVAGTVDGILSASLRSFSAVRSFAAASVSDKLRIRIKRLLRRS